MLVAVLLVAVGVSLGFVEQSDLVVVPDRTHAGAPGLTDSPDLAESVERDVQGGVDLLGLERPRVQQ